MNTEKNRTIITRKKENLTTSTDSPVKVFIIPIDEGLVCTQDVLAILRTPYTIVVNEP